MIEIGKWNDLKVIRSKDFGIYLGEEDSSTAETVCNAGIHAETGCRHFEK